MKKSLSILLLISMVLCTACAKTPDTQPPKDSVMLESTFAIAGGTVTKQTMNCAAADYTEYYTYTRINGVENLEEGKKGISSPLTFAQLQKALDVLANYIAGPDFNGFAGPYENGVFRPEARWYSIGDTAPQEFQWYFVYSVSQNTLTPLNGTYTGSRKYGILGMSNIDQFGNVTDGTNQGKHCYVFIDQ